jgi:hypothetical protein
MKKVKQMNNWLIKERRLDEVPKHIADDHRYCVCTLDGIIQEDNLSWDDATGFCTTTDRRCIKRKCV